MQYFLLERRHKLILLLPLFLGIDYSRFPTYEYKTTKSIRVSSTFVWGQPSTPEGVSGRHRNQALPGDTVENASLDIKVFIFQMSVVGFDTYYPVFEGNVNV